MNCGNADQVPTVLLVYRVQVGLVLEVVEVGLAICRLFVSKVVGSVLQGHYFNSFLKQCGCGVVDDFLVRNQVDDSF